MKNNIEYVIGDTHGEWNPILRFAEQTKTQNNVLYHVGDVGIGFKENENIESQFLYETGEKLKEFKTLLYCIRGNHDNPSWFNKTRSFSNIILLEDFSIVNGILFIGGGTSIDKDFRTEGIDWWTEEKISEDYETVRKISRENELKGIISHASPETPFVTLFKTEDERILREHRDIVLENQPNLRFWIHGHYHKSNVLMLEGHPKYISLGINEIKEITY